MAVQELIVDQFSYQPKPGEVMAKLSAMFPDLDDRLQVAVQLDRYGEVEENPARVQLAILKLCDAEYDRVVALVDLALVDFRDVLAPAEYPNYSKLDPGIDPASPEAQRAISADRDQYEDWASS